MTWECFRKRKEKITKYTTSDIQETFKLHVGPEKDLFLLLDDDWTQALKKTNRIRKKYFRILHVVLASVG